MSSKPEITRDTLRGLIDHTLLKPEAGPADVVALVAEAQDLGVLAVCVSPSMVSVALEAARANAGDRAGAGPLVIATVVGFPSGKHCSEIKAAEAALAVTHGAEEVDMVIDIGAVIAGDLAAAGRDIAAVRAAAPAPTVLKVIIESAALDDEAIVAACEVAEAAGADFVKTSTGFHPAGGASVHAVKLMAKTTGGRLGVKASGGIRDAAAAVAMVKAGATRLGLSGTRAVLDGVSWVERR